MQVRTFEQEFGRPLTIRELASGFNEDTATGGVTAMNGKLNIRPPYQREFVYSMERQQEVIQTVLAGYPLNVMYWAKADFGMFEMMDGQQRTLSICKFIDGQTHAEFEKAGIKANGTFGELGTRQESFLNYPLTVYICDGTEDEKLAWFRIINIAGVRLTEQEMRNAIYNGPWVTEAKKYFSRPEGEGFMSEGKPENANGHLYCDYLDVVGGNNSEKENSVVRQKLFETALKWAADAYNREHGLKGKEALAIGDYMGLHRNDPNAEGLKEYYTNVMEWAKSTFPTYHDVMKKVDWGLLYNEYGPGKTEGAGGKVEAVMEHAAEISNIKEAYHAVLAGDLKFLNARAFNKNDVRARYEAQKGVCPYCGKRFELSQMHADHIRPWSKGGKTDRDNLQLLCAECNIRKSNFDAAYAPWDRSVYEEFSLEAWTCGKHGSAGEKHKAAGKAEGRCP